MLLSSPVKHLTLVIRMSNITALSTRNTEEIDCNREATNETFFQCFSWQSYEYSHSHTESIYEAK